VFTAHDFNDGGKTIEKTLRKNRAQASFFFTGDFYANPENQELINGLKADGHYLGAHSDKHLLYADWVKRDSLLLSRVKFEADLKANYQKMADLGIDSKKANYFLPPYEWYNSAITDWSRQLGLQMINFTPGTGTNADYTTPDMKNYRSSEEILKKLKHFGKNSPTGLNGCIILIHLGSDAARTDKLYNRLDEVISFCKKEGYKTKSL
jgi:peptidoglycan/xylan/chitin deacetylase (PgdA/CDA1 family)